MSINISPSGVLSHAPCSDDRHSPQVVRFKRLRGQLFVESRLHLLTAVYEAITHRVYGRTSPLQSQAQYWETLSSLSLLWSPPSQPSSQPPAAPGPSQSMPLVAPPCPSHSFLPWSRRSPAHTFPSPPCHQSSVSCSFAAFPSFFAVLQPGGRLQLS